MKASLKRSDLLLIASAVLVPAALFAFAVWQSGADATHEADDQVVRVLTDMRDNVHMIFDAERQTLVSVDEYIDGKTWQEIAQPETSAFLRRLADSMEGIQAIWIADPDGYTRATSEPLVGPLPRGPEQELFAQKNEGDLKSFVAEQQHVTAKSQDDAAGVYLTTVLEGASSRIASIDLVRNRFKPNGAFNGIIHAALNSTYFTGLFRTVTTKSEDVVLFRNDGEVLADDADVITYYFQPDTQLMQSIARQSAGHMVANGKELYSYQQIPGFPVYIALGIDKLMIIQRWHRDLAMYGAAALTGLLALLTASWLAVKRATSEKAALTQLNIETEKRLQTEQRLQAGLRMEVIGQLTSDFVHYFNNLLTVMLGSLEMLVSAKTQETMNVIVDRAQRAGERGARLLSNLLTFTGSQRVQVQTVNLNGLLNDLLPLIEQTAGQVVHVELVLDPALLDCNIDLSQLEVAIMNLALNARDAMPKGGTLTISTRNAQFKRPDQAEGSEAIKGPSIAICDTGSGMTDEVKTKIFEPFFTTKDVTSRVDLGLKQVLGFVRQVGGHVTVASEPGENTTVTLFFAGLEPVR